MKILIDKISNKILYLFEYNGNLYDIDGMIYSIVGDGIIKDLNGIKYFVDKTKIIKTNYFQTGTLVYSLRDLGLGATNLIRVRRDSDNQERNFNETEIINNTLLSWVTEESINGNGFITIWYDQSINSNNVIQSIASAQPKIIDNGQLIIENNKPAISFNGTNILSTVLTNTNDAESVFIIGSDFTSGALFSLNKTTLLDKLTFFTTPSVTERTRYNGTNPLLESIRDEIQNSYIFTVNSTLFSYYKNNSLINFANKNFIPTVNQQFNIGSRYINNTQLIGKIQELIYFSSDMTDNLSNIFNNQNKYYNNYFDFESKIILLPDGSGGDIGKGFTITGIQIDYNESTKNNIVVWCANGGTNIQPPSGNTLNLASIVKISINPNNPNLSTAIKLDELLVYEDNNFGTGISIQGITLNNEDNITFVSSDNYIYVYTKQGEFINKFIENSGVNGIAFDFINNYYLVYNILGTLTRYDTSFNLIDIYNLENGVSGDQISYFNNELYVSRGANGLPATYTIYDSNFNQINKNNNVVFESTLACEGIALYDKLLLFASDAYFHPSPPYDYNCITIYRIK